MNEKQASPFARAPFILGLVFVATAGVGGVYLGVSSWQEYEVAAGDYSSSASAPMSEVAISDPSCPASEVSTDLAALTNVGELRVRENLTVPMVESVGPVKTAGLPHCWQHSPQGAVLAGASIVKQLFTQENAVQVVTFYAADSPVREHLLETQDQATPEPKPQAVIFGYKITHAEADFVSFELALGAQWAGDAPFAVKADMTWDAEARDWKILLSKQGWGMRPLPLDVSEAGFTVWKAD